MGLVEVERSSGGKEARGSFGARLLLVGLDGADPGLVERWVEEGRLPNLARLTGEGRWGGVSVAPLVSTLPAWTTVLTGAGPGEHGVLDFTRRRGYSVDFVGAGTRRVPTVLAHLDRLGFRVAALGFPGTYPPERLERGVVIAGWDSPVTASADASFVEPRWLHRRLVAAFGPRGLDFEDAAFDELRLGSRVDPERVVAALSRRIERRSAVAEWLLAQSRWDLFGVYFGETDTAAHHLWPFHDPRSPRRPPGLVPPRRDPLLATYEAADEALGRLWKVASPDSVIVVSDHGSGGSSRRVLYLNRWLAEAGLQRRLPKASGMAARLREKGPSMVPPRLRQLLFRGFGRALPNALESRVRFGGIDFRGTIAFSEELPYAPSVWLNVEGREPSGIVPSRRRREVAVDVARRLEEELRDPWSGASVVRRAAPREEVLCGPALEHAPDILLELELDRGYSYGLLPSARADGAGSSFRRLRTEELLGGKGRALAGSHRPTALLAIWSEGLAAGRLDEGRLEDVAPALCSLLGASPPRADARGPSPGPRASDEGRHGVRSPVLAERLRRLGYID